MPKHPSLCRGNLLLEETTPWTALKKGSEAEKAEARVTLVAVLEGVRIAAVALAPVVPQLSQKIHTQLGLDGDVQVRNLAHMGLLRCIAPTGIVGVSSCYTWVRLTSTQETGILFCCGAQHNLTFLGSTVLSQNRNDSWLLHGVGTLHICRPEHSLAFLESPVLSQNIHNRGLLQALLRIS